MAGPTRNARALILVLILTPVAIFGGLLAVGVLYLARAEAGPLENAIAVSATDDVQTVEMAAHHLSVALSDACALTGCDAAMIHPTLIAAAAAMTESELKEALAAQDRALAEFRSTRFAADPGSFDRLNAEIEINAASRLATLYRLELRNR